MNSVSLMPLMVMVQRKMFTQKTSIVVSQGQLYIVLSNIDSS